MTPEKIVQEMRKLSKRDRLILGRILTHPIRKKWKGNPDAFPMPILWFLTDFTVYPLTDKEFMDRYQTSKEWGQMADILDAEWERRHKPKKGNAEIDATIDRCIEGNKVNWKRVAKLLGISRSTDDGVTRLNSIRTGYYRRKRGRRVV